MDERLDEQQLTWREEDAHTVGAGGDGNRLTASSKQQTVHECSSCSKQIDGAS